MWAGQVAKLGFKSYYQAQTHLLNRPKSLTQPRLTGLNIIPKPLKARFGLSGLVSTREIYQTNPVNKNTCLVFTKSKEQT